MCDSQTTESERVLWNAPPIDDVERPSTTELALCDGQIEGGDVVANLGPVERAQQLQTYVYEDISVMGRTRESKYFDVQTRKVKQILDVARETADDRMGRQLRMAEERVRSSSRAEYEIKRSEFVAEAKEKFHKALISVRADVAVRCEEKIKQHAIDAVRTTSANVDKSLAALAERLRREFEYFKEHNVTEFEDYYGQLLASYRGRFENDFGVLARRHERKYEKAKKSWARELDGALSDDRRRWRPSENPKTIVASREQVEEPAPSSLRRREEETAAGRLEKQIDEKLERLDAADRRARFFKGKIKTVLNNYASLVSSRENHPRAGVCCAPDRGELFRKYLHVPAGAGRTTTIPDDALRNCHV